MLEFEAEKDISIVELKEAIGEEGIKKILLYIKKSIKKGIEKNLQVNDSIN